MIVALLSARFRDLPQIVAALVQILFYITPIIYRPSSLTRFSFIVDFNPMAHLIDLVRAPLIGEYPPMLSWEVAVGLAIVGWVFALAMTGRYLKRIPYWV